MGTKGREGEMAGHPLLQLRQRESPTGLGSGGERQGEEFPMVLLFQSLKKISVILLLNMLLSVLIWNMHTLCRGMETVYKYLAVFAAFSVHAAVSVAVYLEHFVLRTLCCVFVSAVDRETNK